MFDKYVEYLYNYPLIQVELNIFEQFKISSQLICSLCTCIFSNLPASVQNNIVCKGLY